MIVRILVCLCAFALATHAVADDASEAPPTVAVQTEAPREGPVPDILTAYGSAAPALDGGMTLSFQQEGQVLAIAVTPGEAVHAGEQLLEFGASPAAVSAYQQAVSALSVARQQRQHTAQMLSQQLATRDQLGQADKAVADAEATLDALRREGADQPKRTLEAPFDGIVATIPVAPGDRVQAGVTLMTITRLDGLVVTVGIEPDQVGRVHPGQAVRLTSLIGRQALDGQILRVDSVLNPKTRLVDADVSVPPGSVVSGVAFQADIKVGELQGWIVAHDAILADEKGSYLYQADGVTAARVDVTVIGSTGGNNVVQGVLDPNRPVIVQGNYQISADTKIRTSAAR